MATVPQQPALVGRRAEIERLDRLLAAARGGESQALVLRGEPGVGKTTLLQYAVGRAQGFRVVQAAGVQSEMELPFAALHQLCAPMLARLDRLPDPQRDALARVFALASGGPPDRFLVSLAVLGLLAEEAAAQPLLCVVDDVQWLDQASLYALEFVARRVGAESVALVFADRVGTDTFAGVPELVVEGLREADARRLLGAELRWPLDEHIRDGLIAETRGNPLALLELPRGMTPAQLAGGFGLPQARPLSWQIEESYRRRLAELPDDTRLLLLVAAAETLGDPVLLLRAARLLGIRAESAEPATEAGLVEIGARVRFRHPLVRSAVYRAAPDERRRAAHAALAEVTDPELEPDRRAWHRARATAGGDERLAEELERSAGRAQARGGLAAAAAFLARAAQLTPDAAMRAHRALAAARAAYQAGSHDVALDLLASAADGPLDDLERARADVLRAEVAFATSRGGDAPPLLLKAARRLEPLDPALARETYLEAFSAALFVGRLTSAGGVVDVARAARAAPAPHEPARALDLLLDGVGLVVTEGYAAGTPLLARGLEAFRAEAMPVEDEIRWLWLACRIASNLWDDEAWNRLATRHVELARGTGALGALLLALSTRIVVHLVEGEPEAAAGLADEQRAIAEATGTHFLLYAGFIVDAWRGRPADAVRIIDAELEEVRRRGGGMELAITRWWSALVYNALGRYEEALAAAEEESEHPEELLLSAWVLPELIEAAARSGHAERAEDALRRLAETTRAGGHDWGLGIEARCRALLAGDDAAEDHYREAIERLGRSRARAQLARAHLLYGEWLRGQGRRAETREQLRTAHAMFTAAGMEGFAERARRELLAAGEAAPKPGVRPTGALTAQEAQIARLARDGLSNPEIGARLFISGRTVEYHLRKVFAKLDISARGQLGRALVGTGEMD